jgi:FimV-like protein
VQLKLDLAREYLEVGEADLAVQLVQEVFELEVATARELNSELLRETRDLSPGDEVGDRDG